MMCVRIACRETGRIPSVEHILTIIGDQHDFPSDHVDELIFVGMASDVARTKHREAIGRD